jgi:hypothetical protein
MNKTSETRGRTTSAIEVTNISRHGFWLWLRDRELFVPFAEFPWFREAPIGKLLNVQWPTTDHLYWPDLDLDLSVQSIERPDEFPLVSRGA